MDPITITATVVTFATAVKDLVELGEKIHESFAKVSRNRRNAQRTAENIKEMVDDIGAFCEAHKATLANMKEFNGALEGLLRKFRDFETSILPLVPQRRGSWLSFLHGWLNNNKIESTISDLERDVVEVMRRHMMKSALRIEVKQEVNHEDTSRRLNGISHGLEIVRRDVSAIRVTAAAGATSKSFSEEGWEAQRSLIMFAQSTISASAPMLRMPNSITEELMTTAFIKFQIDCIAAQIERIPTLRMSGSRGTDQFTTSLCEIDTSTRIATSHIRHGAVRAIMDIRDVLSDTECLQAISIDRGAQKLNTLSLKLSALSMTEEAIRVGNWAITLARALSDASYNGGITDRAYLALFLTNQSQIHHEFGNTTQSREAIEEAMSLTQVLLCQAGVDTKLLVFRSDVLMRYALITEDNKVALEMCCEAIQLLERILGVQAFSRAGPNGHIDQVVQSSSTFLDRLFSSSPPVSLLDRYKTALEHLKAFLLHDGQIDRATDLAFLNIALLRKLCFLHGRDFRKSLAFALSYLCGSDCALSCANEDLLSMAIESAHFLRELAETNPMHYARELVYVLWKKARVLRSLNQGNGAIATWEEAVSLAGNIVQDPELHADTLLELSNQYIRMEMHNDAARTMTLSASTFRGDTGTEATTYMVVSREFLVARQYQESVNAGKKAIALFRQTVVRNSDPQWTAGLLNSLSLLAHSHVALGDHPQGVVEWKESVHIMDRMLTTASHATITELFDAYLNALRRHTSIGNLLGGKDVCLNISQTATQHLNQLFDVEPENERIIQILAQAELYYARNLARMGRLQDAVEYIEEWDYTWNTTAAPFSDAVLCRTWLEVQMIIVKADAMDVQACTCDAVSVIQNLQSIQQSTDTLRHFLVVSMVHEIRLDLKLGNFDKALETAEKTLHLSDESLWQSIWSHFGVALAALLCGSYQRSLEAAQEGIQLSTGPDWEDYDDDDLNIFIRPSLFAMLSSAEANLGRISTALELAHQAVTLSLNMAERTHTISAVTATQSYMETRGYLAEVLLATGDLTQARQICDERRAYFQGRVQDRVGEYRDLAPILRMLGVLCCADGHHEEEEAAARELSEIMGRLAVALPSLHEQVKIRLRHHASVPILRCLDDMLENLDCEHQKGIMALFKI